MHEVALRRQGEQMLIGNSRALLRGIPNQFPLIGRRQRNARRLLEPLQAIARHPFPITQHRDDRRHARITLLGSCFLGQLGCEDGATIAAP